MIFALLSLLTNSYIPHGHCYLWQPPLVWLHFLSDSLIAIAYYSIPICIIYFIRQREDVPFRNIFILFCLFILSCGSTHLIGTWTIWYPTYWLLGIFKAITALISVYTVVELVPILPLALALPSPAELEALNHNLAQQILEKEIAEKALKDLNQELEERVIKRTQELEKSKIFAERIANLTPDFIYIYDLIDNCYIYTNNHLQNNLGYSYLTPEKIQPTFLEKLCHPLDLPAVKEHLNKFNLNPNSELFEIEFRLLDNYNQWHWFYSKETIIEYTPTGKARQILGIATDISERKQLEITLTSVNQELREQVNDLSLRNQEMTQLAEINKFLHLCTSVEELEKNIKFVLEPLFNNIQGALFTVDADQHKLEIACQWGETFPLLKSFNISDCQAFYQNYNYELQPDNLKNSCEKLNLENESHQSICIPLIAQDNYLGLLYCGFPKGHYFQKSEITLLETIAKQIALTLANLKLQQRLKEESVRDSLTGLYNRRYLEGYLNQKIKEARFLRESIGLMIVDIDHFKTFNDNYGHQAGDLILQEIAKFLKSQVRDKDIVCRYGGEELVIVMPQMSLKDAKKRAKHLKAGIKKIRIDYKNQPLPTVTASFGIAVFPDHGLESEEILRVADLALYEAKNQGRDRIICAIPAL